MDIILVSEQEGIKKPQAEIFIRALERLYVRPKESVYVGDHLENDVIGARNAGLNAIWIVSGLLGSLFTDDYVMNVLKELLHLADTL